MEGFLKQLGEKIFTKLPYENPTSKSWIFQVLLNAQGTPDG